MPRTKALIRKPQPGLPETCFRETLDAEGFADRYVWLNYAPDKAKTKLVVPTVTHMNFNEEASLFDFITKFDGHAFEPPPPHADAEDGDDRRKVASSGPRIARVGCVPNQKTPRVLTKPRYDLREGAGAAVEL